MVKVIYIVVKLGMYIYVISSFAKQESSSDPEINEASGGKKVQHGSGSFHYLLHRLWFEHGWEHLG